MLKTSKTVYHGTPADFEQFNTDAVGQGEGNQTYGWGLYFTESKVVAEHYRKTLAQNKGKGDGFTYEAQIPDGPYLMWDDPLSSQPQIQSATQRYKPMWGNGTGKDFYYNLVNNFKQEAMMQAMMGGGGGNVQQSELAKKASMVLSQCGIKGIQYLDGVSREVGQGSYNYVVFKDSDVHVTNKSTQFTAKLLKRVW